MFLPKLTKFNHWRNEYRGNRLKGGHLKKTRDSKSANG